MKIRTFTLSLTLIFGFLAKAQRSPQDSWYLDRTVPFSDIPGLDNPYGITFSEDGNMYVVDHGGDRIVWESNGNSLDREVRIGGGSV